MLHDSRGAVIDGVAYFHGHTWPDPSLLGQKQWVISHNHPTIKLTDVVGHTVTKQAWIRARLDRDIVAKNYKPEEFDWAEPELFVVPSFNELCGGIAFNESFHDDLLGPLFASRAVHLENAEVYLLDGTFMGSIEGLAAVLPGTVQDAPHREENTDAPAQAPETISWTCSLTRARDRSEGCSFLGRESSDL